MGIEGTMVMGAAEVKGLGALVTGFVAPGVVLIVVTLRAPLLYMLFSPPASNVFAFDPKAFARDMV